jgi:modulator of FtsH protease HflC
MKTLLRSAGFVALLVLFLLVFRLTTYTVNEGENVIITQFGRPIGLAITNAGLHFKMPFIQQVNRLDVRIQEWDGQAVSMPTRDKLYITVDSFGRWRIADPLLWFTRLRDERSALSRIEDIVGSENRNAVARHDLIEIVRTDKTRSPIADASFVSGNMETNIGVLPPISLGREAIEQDVLRKAAGKLKEFGIELVDTKFMRINYSSSVTAQINNRMISERKQIADRFRSEGEGEAARILGNRERELQRINSEAYATVQKIQGEADATAIEIYAKAYNQSPVAVDLYAFLKTMDTYKKMATNDVTLVLSTESDIFHYLKTIEPRTLKPEPAAASTPERR